MPWAKRGGCESRAAPASSPSHGPVFCQEGCLQVSWVFTTCLGPCSSVTFPERASLMD